jgi:hypothetical protein
MGKEMKWDVTEQTPIECIEEAIAKIDKGYTPLAVLHIDLYRRLKKMNFEKKAFFEDSECRVTTMQLNTQSWELVKDAARLLKVSPGNLVNRIIEEHSRELALYIEKKKNGGQENEA